MIVIRCSRCGRVLYSLSYLVEKRVYRGRGKRKKVVGVYHKRVVYVPDEVVEAARTKAARFMFDDFMAALLAGRCPYCGNELRVRKIRVDGREVDLSELEK